MIIDEIKNNTVYCSGLNYEKASEELKSAIIEQIEKTMKERLDDVECYLDKSGYPVILETTNALDDIQTAEVIYKGNDGEWLVDSECFSYNLYCLSAEKLLELYHCFEKTIENIETLDK